MDEIDDIKTSMKYNLLIKGYISEGVQDKKIKIHFLGSTCPKNLAEQEKRERKVEELLGELAKAIL